MTGGGAAEALARSRVHTAKVALGERGTPRWEQSLAERRQRWEDGAAAKSGPQQDQSRVRCLSRYR
ncbi:hypothetical protein [Streptomyces niger]|uniref:hypothetical protein n=1 Tax=Streptomyces niger TaxID=66373 RepID=UPI000AC1819D|nr:hypothetical protein [Streptomyces niger]